MTEVIILATIDTIVSIVSSFDHLNVRTSLSKTVSSDCRDIDATPFVTGLYFFIICIHTAPEQYYSD